MAVEAERDDDDLAVVDQIEDENPDDLEEGAVAEGDDPPDDGEDDLTIEIEGDPEPVSETELLKHLRGEIRKRDNELASLRKTTAPAKIEVGPKPTIEGCDYDDAKFEAAWEEWNARKAASDAQAADANKGEEAERAAFLEDVQNFERQKTALKVSDFGDAEQAVADVLSPTQATVLLKAAGDKAKVILALGRHPAKLAELAKVNDPIKFAASIVRLEGSLKVTTRRKGVEPDVPTRGSGPLAKGEDKTLARLEAEADRTGDRTKVVNYKREQKAKTRQ